MSRKIPEADEVADLLHATTRSLRRAFRRDLDPAGITPAQWRALRAVDRFERPVRMSELAERLGIARRSATGVVDGLEERGLLRRASDPDDRRSVVVSLTRSGSRLLADFAEQRRRAAARRLERLTPAELRTLRDLLQRLVGEDRDGATQATS